MSQNNEYKPKSVFASMIIPIGLLAILGSYILFVFNQDKLETKVTNVTVEKEQLKDTVQSLHKEIDSVVAENEKQQAILALVSDYYRYRNFKQKDSLMNMLADTFEVFYTFRHAAKIDIDKDFQRYWKRNPTSRYFLDAGCMTITKLDSNNHEIRVKSYYTKDAKTIGSIMSVIRVDANKKIYYVRDLNAV